VASVVKSRLLDAIRWMVIAVFVYTAPTMLRPVSADQPRLESRSQ